MADANVDMPEGEDAEKAAVLIQSQVRRKSAMKTVEEKKKAKKEAETVPEAGGDDEAEQAQAATMIQSQFRRKQANDTVAEKRREKQAKDASSALLAISFVVLPEGFIHKAEFSPSTLVSEAMSTVAAELKLDPSSLVSTHGKDTLSNNSTLANVFGNETKDLRLDIITNTNVNAEGDTGLVFGRATQMDTSHQKDKPYLGGFRNRKTGILYHHAMIMTDYDPDERWAHLPKRNHRETQTMEVKTRSQQSSRESSTQMAREDLHIDDSGDRVIAPGSYFTSDELAELKYRMSLVIQRYWRGYRARKEALRLTRHLQEKEEKIRSLEDKKSIDANERHRKEIERRMHPRSFDDFEILYNELETWRQNETERIQYSDLSKDEKHAMLVQLLHKETKLLQTIDRLKINANGENRAERITKTLALMAEPKKWELGNGDVTEVHTPFSTRARELMELYHGLNLPLLTTDERLDVLLHVKWTVKEFDCNLTRDVVELIDREADMLNRGRNVKSLQGLRKRLSNLFLQFLETPEFNPEASRFQKVPTEFLTRPEVQPIKSGSHPR